MKGWGEEGVGGSVNEEGLSCVCTVCGCLRCVCVWVFGYGDAWLLVRASGWCVICVLEGVRVGV